jgi:hypothetical protein
MASIFNDWNISLINKTILEFHDFSVLREIVENNQLLND